MTGIIRYGLAALLLIALAEAPVEAYLDPGAGSMLLQLVLGGVAALGVIGKLFWERLTLPFKRRNADTGKS